MDIKHYIDLRIIELKSLILKKQNALEKTPAGYLRLSGTTSNTQYYHRKTKEDKKGQYIRKNNIELVKALAQKDYDEKVLQTAMKELAVLEKLSAKIHVCDVKEIYNNLIDSRKDLVKPDFISDNDYIADWQNITYEKKPVEQQTEYYTARGEKVRSKSEILIADMLYRMKIPYHYEMPLELSGVIVHPDFALLNVRRRQVIYLEHLGMMDNPEYCQHAMDKILLYEKNKIFPGDKLIITHETQSRPLNIRLLENVIRFYLK